MTGRTYAVILTGTDGRPLVADLGTIRKHMRMDEPQYSLKVSVAATRHGLAHHQKPVLVLLLSPLLLQNRLLVFACLPLADKHHGDICADRVKARLAAIRSLVSGAETNVRLYHRQYVHVVMLARLWEEARAGTVLSRLFPTMPGPPKHGFKQFHPPVTAFLYMPSTCGAFRSSQTF